MTAPEHPAAVLRRAAGLILERAEAASLLTPGPWGVEVEGQPPAPWVKSSNGKVIAAAYRVDADHIASWHPLAALAVAAWLEATATRAASEVEWLPPECGHTGPCGCDLTPRWSCRACLGWLGDGCGCGWAEALTVARAYLGDENT